MADTYLELVNRGFTKKLAKTAGPAQALDPAPATPRAPLVPGPVLVLGNCAGAAPGLSDTLLGWDLDVHRHAVAGRRDRRGRP